MKDAIIRTIKVLVSAGIEVIVSAKRIFVAVGASASVFYVIFLQNGP